MSFRQGLRTWQLTRSPVAQTRATTLAGAPGPAS